METGFTNIDEMKRRKVHENRNYYQRSNTKRQGRPCRFDVILSQYYFVGCHKHVIAALEQADEVYFVLRHLGKAGE